LQWFIENHIPFSTVEHKCFKEAMVAVNAGIKDYLFGWDAMRNWAKDEFNIAKGKIKEVLKESLSKIHISHDPVRMCSLSPLMR
jgi:hypothetical protein